MYISCPNCATKFVIKPEQIGTEGRDVRCSRCGYAWHASENNLSGIIANKPYVPTKGVNLPAIIPNNNDENRQNPLLNLMILFFCFVIFGSVIYFKNLWEQNRKLKIEDLVISKNLDDTLVIGYKIKHQELKPFKLPLIRVRIFDKDFKLLGSYIGKDILGAKIEEGSANIKTEFFNISQDCQYADVTLGGYFDFIF